MSLLSKTIRDGRVTGPIHKYLKAGVLENGVIVATEAGPLSPLCSNIVLNSVGQGT